MTHFQWIYRCVHVHDHDMSTDTLVLTHKEDLMKEITHQLEMRAEGLVEDNNNRFLLEANSRSTGFLPFRRQGRCATSAPWHRTCHSTVGAELRNGKGITRVHFNNAYACHHLVWWAEQFPGIRHPGRREPSLHSSDCNAVLYPCLGHIKTPIG